MAQILPKGKAIAELMTAPHSATAKCEGVFSTRWSARRRRTASRLRRDNTPLTAVAIAPLLGYIQSAKGAACSSEKEQVALTSIAASAALTIAKGAGRLCHRLAGDSVGSRPLADRSRRHRDDLCRRAHFRQAGRRGASLRPRQVRKRLGAGRNRAAVPAVGRRDLGSGQAPDRARTARRRTPMSGPSA